MQYIKNNHIIDDEFAILSALTLGYKDELDQDIQTVFSSAGAMHVLAVSGLHVGILYVIINLLIGFLRKYNKGRILYTILAILLLWIYALVTGFSPSVLRSATMFFFCDIGKKTYEGQAIYTIHWLLQHSCCWQLILISFLKSVFNYHIVQ